MTFNQFKLLCIGYLKPFEGKPFNELISTNNERLTYNFNLNNISFKLCSIDIFMCEENSSGLYIIRNNWDKICLWNDRILSFVPIKKIELLDII